MLIGIPKEIKSNECRVGLTPAGVHELIRAGHEVLVESDAGGLIGLTDDLYRQSGADILDSAEEIYAQADIIVKVKEPQKKECQWLRPGQVLFTFLHLAASRELTQDLLESGASCMAYETVTGRNGDLPLLAPMSEIAGRMSIQAGIHALENPQGGNGILLGGTVGVEPAKVVVLGGGVVGEHAARLSLCLGGDTTVIDKSLSRLRQLDTHFGPQMKTLFASHDAVELAINDADLVIGAVLIPGAKAPKIITKKMLRLIKPKAVLVDVSIDQGGCFETSRITTHENPTFVEQNIIHYCVPNMPGAVANTATYALTHVTCAAIIKLANQGLKIALKKDKYLLKGLNIHEGKVTHQAVATAHDYRYFDPIDIFS
jgi:alanine dehydrogenase|tara:strand:- start:2432 stop:3547 length:1116 start_codon:yes stop_codon:yes gene_type:complete